MSSQLHAVSVDRFPCASLTSPFVTIGSNGPGAKEHEFDKVFDSVLQREQRVDPMSVSIQRMSGCRLDSRAVQSWLVSLVRPLGTHTLLGAVPVKVHGLKLSSACINIGKRAYTGSHKATAISRIEFVVHRYGDDNGVHYMAHVSADVPCKLYAYKRLGDIPADILWSLDADADASLI